MECCDRPVDRWVHDRCVTCRRLNPAGGLGIARQHVHIATPAGDLVLTSECHPCRTAGEQLTLTL